MGAAAAVNAIDDFADMMTQDVKVEPFIARDSYGKATYGAPTVYKARVNFKSHFVRSAGGEQIVARGIAWLAAKGPTQGSIDARSRITLPDGSQPLILDSNLENDETAPLYVRLDFS